MTNLEKAKAQLESVGIQTYIYSDRSLYVRVMDAELELSQFEIDFRASVYDENPIEYLNT